MTIESIAYNLCESIEQTVHNIVTDSFYVKQTTKQDDNWNDVAPTKTPKEVR